MKRFVGFVASSLVNVSVVFVNSRVNLRGFVEVSIGWCKSGPSRTFPTLSAEVFRMLMSSGSHVYFVPQSLQSSPPTLKPTSLPLTPPWRCSATPTARPPLLSRGTKTGSRSRRPSASGRSARGPCKSLSCRRPTLDGTPASQPMQPELSAWRSASPFRVSFSPFLISHWVGYLGRIQHCRPFLLLRTNIILKKMIWNADI